MLLKKHTHMHAHIAHHYNTYVWNFSIFQALQNLLLIWRSVLVWVGPAQD